MTSDAVLSEDSDLAAAARMKPLYDSLTSVLNRLHAMVAIGLVSVAGIAKAIRAHRQDVSQWILKRDHKPNGEATALLVAYAAKMTLKIAMSPPRVRSEYRTAYDEACQKFPLSDWQPTEKKK